MNPTTSVRSATTHSTSTPPHARAGRPVGGNRFADYVLDVFFIALLAAPFVIFATPASMQDAVVSSHTPATSIVSTAAAAATAAPRAADAAPPAADGAYGPE